MILFILAIYKPLQIKDTINYVSRDMAIAKFKLMFFVENTVHKELTLLWEIISKLFEMLYYIIWYKIVKFINYIQYSLMLVYFSNLYNMKFVNIFQRILVKSCIIYFISVICLSKDQNLSYSLILQRNGCLISVIIQ